jgi:hypothetical protein
VRAPRRTRRVSAGATGALALGVGVDKTKTDWCKYLPILWPEGQRTNPKIIDLEKERTSIKQKKKQK